ncbi:hypothetical protein WBG78_29820 [Chryseolinea sp. T2]|uniref:LVIVD repeat-containing protein n=1 Tax=Chryseolinea sp. T2 TaxID=3129255 RepID=UPI00307794B0
MDTLDHRLQKRIHVSLYALLFLTVLLGISVLLEGCTNSCETTQDYVYYEPVYTTVEQIRAQVALEGPRSITTVGKIYYKDGFMYVNEPGEGIHIIDNTNPSQPVAKNFLVVPGNFDLAIKGNTLYADSFIDLVALDISNPSAVKEVGRLNGVFKHYTVMGLTADVNCCVITSWKENKSVTITQSDCSFVTQPWGGFYYDAGLAFASSSVPALSSKTAIAPGNGSGPGVGGSLARFTISNDHLYMIDGTEVIAVNVLSEQGPKESSRTSINWDMETIFPHKDKLYIGARTGMYIVDISSPESPAMVSRYQHITSCDPVVVDDKYAYVTLRTENMCQAGQNLLEVIDIENPQQPTLVKSYAMSNPHGLGIDQSTLFICDGDDGLKAFDATDVLNINNNLLAHYKGINATDVIPFKNLLMMIGEDGIFQYDYTNPKDIKLLSQINIGVN